MFKEIIEFLIPSNTYMAGFDPLTMGAISIGSGLLSGLFGSQESDQEKAIRRVLDKLDANQNFFKQTPFTKDEFFNTIMPKIQQTQRNAADVAAGRLGAAVGETNGVAGGQGAMDYYLQTLAPIIAQGEQGAAQTYENFVKMWAQMDDNAKRNFMQSLNMEAGLTQGLPDMSKGQEFLTNFLSGAQIGTTAYGNISQAQALANKGDALSQIAGNIQGQSLTNIPDVNISTGGLGTP